MSLVVDPVIFLKAAIALSNAAGGTVRKKKEGEKRESEINSMRKERVTSTREYYFFS